MTGASRSRWALILAWTTAASVCTFLLFVPLGAVAASIRSEMGSAAIAPAMFLFVLYSPFLAPLIVLGTWPVYLLLFWTWGRACDRHPRLDENWSAILSAAAVASLVPALASAALWARGPSGVEFETWLAWLPSCVLIWSGAMVAPRWLFEALRPGRLDNAAAEDDRQPGWGANSNVKPTRDRASAR